VDLTADSDDEPPTKKIRTSASLGTLTTPMVAASSGAAEQWRYTPTSPDKLDTHPIKQRTEAEVLAQKARKETFKNKLLLENNSFLRKKADTPVECIELDGSVIDSEDSDHAFKELNKMFSNKAKGKGKVSIPTKPSKKPGIIGPSGQSYTPLENQVSTTIQISGD
jgi:DNA mismatch repair protein MSH3